MSETNSRSPLCGNVSLNSACCLLFQLGGTLAMAAQLVLLNLKTSELGRVERNVDKQIFHNHKLTLPQSVVVAHGRARRGLIAWLLDELLLDRPDFRGLGANVDVGALFGGFGYVVLVGERERGRHRDQDGLDGAWAVWLSCVK